MNITIPPLEKPLPVDRAHVLSMTIKTFKGRRNVEVHLFRSHWPSGEETHFDWKSLLAPDAMRPGSDAPECKNIVLEAFTEVERDTIINYLKGQYSTRITSINAATLSFPIPAGLPPLSSVAEGKNIGFIVFEKIPSYSLEIPLKGLYDLSQHRPIVAEE
ncbi:hypothetical protein [Salidesulfovibrio onnuriiensis]|uniref:hypothetical protein n=1 Tax=Salidesulfovibrio onnuriiensis TaxID=2583823 RepID=UPI0011C7A265|nr:hypothetical protein [Salidesulfovibrio onnuriiensis]